jgi:hypothetical protein
MLTLPFNFLCELRHKSTVCTHLSEAKRNLSFKPDLSNNTAHHIRMLMYAGSAVIVPVCNAGKTV